MNEQMKTEDGVLDSEVVLELLREIELNPQATQRDLSGKFGISLGKLNSLVRTLIENGIITARDVKNSRNKKAYLYLLTPAGIKLRFDLTRKFFEKKEKEYKRFRLEIQSLNDKLVSSVDNLNTTEKRGVL